MDKYKLLEKRFRLAKHKFVVEQLHPTLANKPDTIFHMDYGKGAGCGKCTSEGSGVGDGISDRAFKNEEFCCRNMRGISSVRLDNSEYSSFFSDIEDYPIASTKSKAWFGDGESLGEGYSDYEGDG